MIKAPQYTDNVKFSLLTEGSGVDEDTNLPQADITVATSIPGQLLDAANAQEPYRDRSGNSAQYRLVCRTYPPDITITTFSKKVVVITHKYDSRLSRWKALTTKERYSVLQVSPVQEHNDQEVYLVCEVLGNSEG